MDTVDFKTLFSSIDSRIETIQATVEGMNQTVEALSKVLIIGNGQPPLTVRVALVESESRSYRREVEELKATLEAKANRNWQSVMVIVASGLSLVTALITALLKHS